MNVLHIPRFRLSIGVALSVTAVVMLISATLATRSLAAAPPNVTYVGTQSNSDAITLVSNPTGARFASIRTTPSGLTGCAEAFGQSNVGTLTPENTSSPARRCPAATHPSGTTAGRWVTAAPSLAPSPSTSR